MEVLVQNVEIMKDFKPLDGSQLRVLLARTQPSARTGNYEKFRTATMYDGAGLRPEWLG